MRQASNSYLTQSAQLKQIRRADPGEQARHSLTAQQQTPRRPKPRPDPAAPGGYLPALVPGTKPAVPVLAAPRTLVA